MTVEKLISDVDKIFREREAEEVHIMTCDRCGATDESEDGAEVIAHCAGDERMDLCEHCWDDMH